MSHSPSPLQFGESASARRARALFATPMESTTAQNAGLQRARAFRGLVGFTTGPLAENSLEGTLRRAGSAREP